MSKNRVLFVHTELNYLFRKMNGIEDHHFNKNESFPYTKMLAVFSDIIIFGEKCHESHEGIARYKVKRRNGR